MAKKSMIAREIKRQKTVERFAAKRALLAAKRSTVFCLFISLAIIDFFAIFLPQLTNGKFSSLSKDKPSSSFLAEVVMLISIPLIFWTLS